MEQQLLANNQGRINNRELPVAIKGEEQQRRKMEVNRHGDWIFPKFLLQHHQVQTVILNHHNIRVKISAAQISSHTQIL
jgi:hypothetical protein